MKLYSVYIIPDPHGIQSSGHGRRIYCAARSQADMEAAVSRRYPNQEIALWSIIDPNLVCDVEDELDDALDYLVAELADHGQPIATT